MTGPTPSRSDERFADSVELPLPKERDALYYEGSLTPTLRANHEHLLAAYEELSIAEDELRAQHQAIIETQRLLEIQRNRYRTLFLPPC